MPSMEAAYSDEYPPPFLGIPVALAHYHRVDAGNDPAKSVWNARWQPADEYEDMSNEVLHEFFEPKDKCREFLMGDRAHVCECDDTLPLFLVRPVSKADSISLIDRAHPSPRSLGDHAEPPEAGPRKGACRMGQRAGGPAGTRVLPGRQRCWKASIRGDGIRLAGRVAGHDLPARIFHGPTSYDTGFRIYVESVDFLHSRLPLSAKSTRIGCSEKLKRDGHSMASSATSGRTVYDILDMRTERLV